MSTAPKLAQRLANPGSFATEQQQRLAQDTARKVNSFSDMLNAMVNRSYVALATDATLAGSALVFTTLLTSSITTVLASGFLIITFTASGTHALGGATTYFRVTVDGVTARGAYVTVSAAGYAFTAAIMVRVPVTRGAHAVLAQWSTDNNSSRIRPATNVSEHAGMLVQEAS